MSDLVNKIERLLDNRVDRDEKIRIMVQVQYEVSLLEAELELERESTAGLEKGLADLAKVMAGGY